MSNHFVPHHAPIPYLQKNALNPSDKKIVKRNLNIDTLFRKNYEKTTSTDFLYTLPEPINNVVSLNITAIEIPYVWYSFDERDHSNEFTITIRDCSSVVTGTDTYAHTFRIPSGNYGSADLIAAMNNYFNNLGDGFLYLYFDIEETSSKTIIRVKSFGEDQLYNDGTLYGTYPNCSIDIDFRIESDPTRPLYKNAGWMLGFKQATYTIRYDAIGISNYVYLTAVQSFRYYLISESSYGNSLQNYFFIEIDDFHKNFSTNMLMSSTAGSYLGNNIMGRIQVVSGFNTILTNTNNDFVFKIREYFGPIKLEKMWIRILDRFGNPLNINGNDFSMLLEIEQLYSQ